MKKFKLFEKNVKYFQKLTVVYGGEFGGLTAIQTTALNWTVLPHYYNCPENMNGVVLEHKPREKRSTRKLNISYNTPLVVYDGWLDIDTESIVYKKVRENVHESRYDMHSKQYFYDLLEQYPDGILFTDI